MMKYIEEHEEQNIFIYNVFPMRNDIIPKSIKIDTTTLVHLLITEKYGNKTFYTEKGMLKKLENNIWNFFFRTERKCFHHKYYTFHHMIYTDGISCSIIMLRNDKVGKKIFNQKIKPIKEKYIDKLDNYEVPILSGKNASSYVGYYHPLNLDFIGLENGIKEVYEILRKQ